MQKFDKWTSAALAAQCVFPRLDTELYFEDESYKQSRVQLVKIGVGGFCIFKGSILSVTKMTQQLQALSDVPLLFCADFENGLHMRLEDGTSFPHALALGIADDTENTRKIAKAIAEEAKDIGVYWNLAPVSDVNSNPLNPIINIRSFGTDFQKVSEHVAAYIEGTQSEKVLATAKHFPGHGDTDVDSHIELPILKKSYSEILNNELLPFKKAIESGVKSIMTGHLIFKDLDSELPASLSRRIIKELLRDELQFNGIILTDALDMKGVTNNFPVDELAVLAIKAGNDVALMPENPKEAIELLVKAIDASEDLRSQVIESVNRIYNSKRYCGLIPGFAKLEGKQNLFVKHLNLALKAALKAVISDCPAGALPIDTSKQFAAFSVLQSDEDLQSASRFFTMLAQATENDCDFGYIDANISEDEILQLNENIGDAEFLIFAIFARGRAYQGSAQLADKLIEAITKISGGRRSYILVFGNPYFSVPLPTKNVIYTFSDSFPSLAAAVMKLAGRELVEGIN